MQAPVIRHVMLKSTHTNINCLPQPCRALSCLGTTSNITCRLTVPFVFSCKRRHWIMTEMHGCYSTWLSLFLSQNQQVHLAQACRMLKAVNLLKQSRSVLQALEQNVMLQPQQYSYLYT